MYCPQCGQEQASSEMRFCSRCGFPLSGVNDLLARGGVTAAAATSQAGKTGPQVRGLSPRQKGTRAGLMQMLSGFLVVPVIAILSHNIFGWQGLIIPLAALITFIGGLLRIIYARLYEDDTPEMLTEASLPAPVHLSARARVSALPPQQSVPASSFAPRRVNTAELVPPPSVTENTTRLLDEDKIKRGE
ncbi:MAG TPA: zinc ribbon domain-containing protein [Pyrinomonadaceae bacterium]|nr:zinc ribbon domain-containing protein [Pyrinomonadaceae bacterium]